MRHPIATSLSDDSKNNLAKLLNYFLKKENLIDDFQSNKKRIEDLLETTKFNDDDKSYFDKIFELKLSYPNFFDNTYEIIKSKFDKAVWKKFEKEKFNELILSHNPDKKICLELLKNIDHFNFEEDYHIIKKLNLNKDKSENSKEIFDKTLEKFMPFLDEEKLHKLKTRMRFDEVFKDLQDRGIYHKEKFNKILKDSKYFDSYILENLNYTENKNLKEIKSKYEKRSINSPILTNSSSPNSATHTPSNSAPNTPNTSASNPNFNVPGIPKVGFGVKITEKKSQCTIS